MLSKGNYIRLVLWSAGFGLGTLAYPASGGPAFDPGDFTDQHCSSCHNDEDKKGGLDLTTLAFTPKDSANFLTWLKVHDRLLAGEMPPRNRTQRPSAPELTAFLQQLGGNLTATETAAIQKEGRATQRRLNGYEYENSLRDLLSAPWLQIRAQFPEDGESHRFNKIGEALDISHVQMSRYMSAADYALRQVMTVELEQVPTATTRYYARDQRTLTSKFVGNVFNTSPDRMTYPVVGLNTPQPDVRWLRAPLTDPQTRDEEAVGWVSSNYVTGFAYRWDQFRAPRPGRYRIRFSGYTLWVPPGGIQMQYKGENDKVGTPRPPNPSVGDYDRPQPGRTREPVVVYTRNGAPNRRVGEFDLTPEPAVYDVGEVWLQANETLVPDAARFYRSRPNNFHNPLMEKDGAPSVAFRWMEVEGPFQDVATTAGYKLLFGDLPLRRVKAGAGGVTLQAVASGEHREGGRNGGQRVEGLRDITVDVISQDPAADSQRLLRNFLALAYRGPGSERDLQRFLSLVNESRAAGLSFSEAMLAGYTAILASPAYIFLNEPAGRLDDGALATRLALFLWNSLPDAGLRARAAAGALRQDAGLRAETERMLADPRAHRFVEAFLDYWIDLRKMEDSTPSTTLYNDYYLDDALTEAAEDETVLYFQDMVARNQPARVIVSSDYTFLNERLARHYNIPGVEGVAMRRVGLPPDSPRGGFMTQASVLKITANGTTTSPVLRGKWIMERILGHEIPPPPPVPSVDPDIRGAVTIRQQLEKHRSNASCASCHSTMDPPGFALESFDVLGGWRDHYRGVDETKVAVSGLGKNGQPFAFHYALPVDATGELPDGRKFADVREYKRLLLDNEADLARNLARQLIIYATGAPIHFTDRAQVERIVAATKGSDYGTRDLICEIVQSDLFRNK